MHSRCRLLLPAALLVEPLLREPERVAVQAVDGVAQVQAWGMVQDSVRIFVSPERMRAHGVGLYDVVAALRRDNFTLPAGSVESGGREFLLRIDSSFKCLELRCHLSQ